MVGSILNLPPRVLLYGSMDHTASYGIFADVKLVLRSQKEVAFGIVSPLLATKLQIKLRIVSNTLPFSLVS